MRYLSPALFAAAALFPDLAVAEAPVDPVAERARSVDYEAPGLDAPYRFSAELASSLGRGNTETFNVAGSLRLELALGARWVSDTRARGLYEESFSSVTANNWAVSERFDRYLTARVSTFAGAGLERDPFAGIEWRYSGQLGVGWLAVDVRDPAREDLVVDSLKLEAGFYGAYEDFVVPPNAPADATLATSDAEIYAGRVAAEYQHAFRKGTSVGAQLELIQDFNDTENTVAQGSVFLTAGIAEGVALKLTLWNRYDNLPAEPTLKEDDLLLTAGIVVSI